MANKDHILFGDREDNKFFDWGDKTVARGRRGDDEYQVSKDMQNVTIGEWSRKDDTDTVIFDSSIDKYEFFEFKTHLIVRHVETGQITKINRQFEDRGVEIFRFEDGDIPRGEIEEMFMADFQRKIVLDGDASDTKYDDWGNSYKTVVKGGKGSDTYVIGKADQKIVIREIGKRKDKDTDTDTIVFEDLTLEDVQFAREGNHLVITNSMTNQTTIVRNQFKEHAKREWGVEKIEFVDGSVARDELQKIIDGEVEPGEPIKPEVVVVPSVEEETKEEEAAPTEPTVEIPDGDFGTPMTPVEPETPAADETPEIIDIRGTEEADVLEGSDAGENIFGLEGDDEIKAGAGDDVIDGGAGVDTVWGGEGSDVYMFDRGSDKMYVIDFEPGKDVVQFTSNLIEEGKKPLDYAYQEGPSTIIHFGADFFVLWGVDMNTLTDDMFEVVDANREEGIVLNGTDGADELVGGTGDDILTGGKGADVLTGGLGADTFIVNSGTERDFIVDFDANHDKIDLNIAVAEGKSVMDYAYQDGNSTVFEFESGDTIVLFDTELADVTEDYFV